MNVITGLPRSGSTLFCNILNQNPRFYAGSTSILPQILGGIIKIWSDSPETRGALARDQQATRDRLRRSLRGFCDSWHQDKLDEDKVVFDKSRGWANHIMALRSIYPKSKAIILVRDLRDVFSSVEKQHQKEPLLDQGESGIDKTIWRRADTMFAPEGMIGGPVEGVLDVIRRKLDTLTVKYERLVERPKAVMVEVYEHLEEEPFDHDFDKIENQAEDLDALYLNKYPHDGSGKMEPQKPDGWKDVYTQDLAATIMKRFPTYNMAFDYK